MLAVIALSGLLTITCCTGTPLSAVWLSPIAPVAPLGQYQNQDSPISSNSYHYAYTGPHHSKVETRLGGTIQGGYSYIDANGILQTISYTADGSNGFRVHGSNIPQNEYHREDNRDDDHDDRNHHHHQQSSEYLNKEEIENIEDHRKESQGSLNDDDNDEEVANNRRMDNNNNNNKNHPFLLSKLQADEISKDIPKLMTITNANKFPSSSSENKLIISDSHDENIKKKSNIVVNHNSEYQHQHQHQHQRQHQVLPSGAQSASAVIPDPFQAHYVYHPIIPYRLMHSSLHHTQDSLGQYDYSYTGDTSSKTESRSVDGTTRGAYSYLDPNGILQQVHYIADQNGFRVAATNLPEA